MTVEQVRTDKDSAMNADDTNEPTQETVERAMAVSPQRRRRFLWVVQIMEYGIGFAVAWSATRIEDPFIPALVAVGIVANAATMRAPLSAFHLTSPRVHRIVGVALSVVTLVCAVFVDMDSSTRALLVSAALIEGSLSVRFGHGI